MTIFWLTLISASFILSGEVTQETFNDTYHIAITVVLGIISYFLIRLIREHDDDRKKIDRMDTKLTRATTDIGWIRRSLKRSRGFDLDERDELDEEVEN